MLASAPWRAGAAVLIALVVLVGGAPSPAVAAVPSAAPATTRSTTPGEVSTARAAALTVSGPRQVGAGARIVFTGKVATAQGRTRKARLVQVAERIAGRWLVVGKARSTRSGTFRIAVRAGDVAGKRVFRGQAPRVGKLGAVRTGRLSIRVIGASGPTGTNGSNGSDWSYLMDGGSRWNPCAPITWSYNPAGQAYDALADVAEALARIAAVSGQTFLYTGTTSLVFLGDPDALAGGAHITVGWANAAQLADLGGSVVGIGGATGQEVSGRDVTWHLVRGWVTLDNADALRPKPGFAAGGFGQVLLHEMLHALGLGHAEGPDQLMYPEAGPQNTTFGAGDLAGIARIGAGAGCL